MISLLLGIICAIVTAVALAWKWQLGVVRTGVSVATLGVAVALGVWAAPGLGTSSGAAQTALVGFATLVLAAGVLVFRFYRDPERTPPDDVDAVLSPADGQIVYVREFVDGALPASSKHGRNYTLRELTRTRLGYENGVVIGISLSFLDVHVTRSPIAGRVTAHERFRGEFASLRKFESIFQNERATVTLSADDGLELAVVHIASRLVRRIVANVREGEEVVAGQRIGVIRMGSQVDVVLPLDGTVRVSATVGDRVSAGTSIIALRKHRPPVRSRSVAGSADTSANLDASA